jgi:hypothetical protein
MTTALMSYLLDHPVRYFAVLLLALVSSSELGIRWSLAQRDKLDQEARSGPTTIHGAILGLLGLMLGFTFVMALSRYDLRRQLVVEEANAIGTIWLRSSMIPEPYRDAVPKLLRAYVDARLDFYSAGLDQKRLLAAVDRTAQLQRSLWSEALGAARDQPTPITALFVQALNEVIDLDTSRVEALENRIPLTVWMLLIAVSILASLVTGNVYPHRASPMVLLVPIVLAGVMALIADLDSSRGGLILVSQQSMVRLQNAMQEPLPTLPSP